MKIIKRILLGIILILVGLPIIGTLYQVYQEAQDHANYPAPGQMIDVDGVMMHIYCTGDAIAGSPTVILENGLGGTSSMWVRVQSELSAATRVCSYDRAGMGWSKSSSEPRDAQHIASELHTLLQAADIPQPYVLVGWSFGGLYIRMYAEQYPEEVVGMVLLDSSHPDQWTSTQSAQEQYQSLSQTYNVLPVLARIGVMRLMGQLQVDYGLPSPQNEEALAFYAATKDWDTQKAEFLASTASSDQVRNISLDDLPLFILSATEHDLPPELERRSMDFQDSLALLSTNSVHVVVEGANHSAFLLDAQTAQVTDDAILRVIEAIQTGEPLHN